MVQPHQREERLRRLLQAVTDYIYHVRVENGCAVETVHDTNCEAVTGYSPQEFSENSLLWIAMVPPDDRGTVERQISQLLSGQDAPPIEHRICKKDGRIRWVLNTVCPQRDDQGRLIGYDGLLRDITKRKGAEEALQLLNTELEQRVAERTEEIRLLAAAVSHLGEGVMITDDELDWPGPRIRFVNEALCRITGYAKDELIGKTPRVLQGRQTDRAVLGNLKNELDAGRSVLAEVTNYRKDGAPYDAELFITPLFDSSGRRTNFVSIHRDITERKRVEEDLRRAHELSESIIDTAPNIILLLDAQGRIQRFNPHMEQLTGWRLSEVQGRDWFDTFLPQRDREQIRGVFAQALGGRRTRAHANPILAKDGRELEIEWSDAPLTSAEGELIGLICTGQDITERKRVERALGEKEERLRAILNAAADAMITIDRCGIISSVNPAAERLFGYAEHEFVGQNVKMLMPPPYRDEHDDYVSRYLRTGQPRIIGVGREVVGRRKDGSTFPVSLAVSEIDHLQMFTGIVRDISAVKELQKQVLEIAAEESRRIGNELHDNIQQQLTGLGLLSQSLAETLAGAHAPQAGLAARLAKGLKEATHDVHLLSRGLVPVEVDAEGLRSALANLASRIGEQHGVDCGFECLGAVQLADNFVATHLYRIAQEAVNNAIKHSQADRIEIVLSSTDGRLTLQVLDNGVGIEEKQESGAGMGLKIMHYRAGLIGAVLSIGPRTGGGTDVTCTAHS